VFAGIAGIAVIAEIAGIAVFVSCHVILQISIATHSLL
jgi:hypothetical protein